MSKYGVSISDEKPLHMRQFVRMRLRPRTNGFNLRREAAPHATLMSKRTRVMRFAFQSQTRSRSTCDGFKVAASVARRGVSISDEKPLHMRHEESEGATMISKWFQSQTRSRSTCDIGI